LPTDEPIIRFTLALLTVTRRAHVIVNDLSLCGRASAGGQASPVWAMSVSQAAICSSVIDCPKLGLSATAAGAKPIIPAHRVKTDTLLGIYMLQCPLLADGPTGNAVEVVEWLVASFGNKLAASRLSIPGLVGRPAL